MNNYVKLKGNLGADPEFRKTQSGKEIALLSVGVSDSYFDKESKEWKSEEVQWFKAAAFKPLDIYQAKNFKKGSLVNIEGKMKNKDYVDAKGITRTSLEIIISSIEEIVRRKKLN